MSNQYSVKDMAHVCSDKDKEIRELQAQVAKMRNALEEIASIAHMSERKPVQNILATVKYTANKALKDIPPT